jgi:hypothetical protein
MRHEEPRANVLNKVALSAQVDLREIYGAPTRAAAEAAIDVFADKYNAKHDKASGNECTDGYCGSTE